MLGHDLDLLRREITEADQVFKGDHGRLRYHRRITQLYLIIRGLQSPACGTAACFVAFLLVLQASVWRPIRAKARTGPPAVMGCAPVGQPRFEAHRGVWEAARGGWPFHKCPATQDDLPIHVARTSTASTRPLRDKVDALHLNVHRIPNPHRSAEGQRLRRVNIGGQAS